MAAVAEEAVHAAEEAVHAAVDAAADAVVVLETEAEAAAEALWSVLRQAALIFRENHGREIIEARILGAASKRGVALA